MLTHHLPRKFLWIAPLVLSTLACNAVSQWTSPHSPSTTSLPAISPSTSLGPESASCTALLPDILHAASSDRAGIIASWLSSGEEQVHYLVVYSLDGEDLGLRDDLLLPPDVAQEIDSRVSHEYIWDYFTALIPAEQRTFVTEFSILSDGPNNILAGVSPTYDNPAEWTLKVDVADAINPYGLTYSLLHEFGHFLTLNSSQVPPDSLVFFHPEDVSLYDQAAASCPQYFTGEGCSNSGSYLNTFFTRFWSDIYPEWQQTGDPAGPGKQVHFSNEFYEMHKDQFLTPYAASNPEEDIAESWTYFILSPKPAPATVADQKILFFYEYPELVALREQILTRLCTSFPRN
jgi:hypothetical protein